MKFVLLCAVLLSACTSGKCRMEDPVSARLDTVLNKQVGCDTSKVEDEVEMFVHTLDLCKTVDEQNPKILMLVPDGPFTTNELACIYAGLGLYKTFKNKLPEEWLCDDKPTATLATWQQGCKGL